MIVKSYEVKKNSKSFLNHSFILLYGENFGLKKDIKEYINNLIKQKDSKTEVLSLYEDEIIKNDEIFYNFIYSGSLFSSRKIITIYEATDKLIKKIDDIYSKYPENISVIIFSGILEKKSKLRNFFEKNTNTICIPCYADNDKDLELIANIQFKKHKINLSKEVINFLIEKSNSDRHNLKNEIDKIISYSQNKKKLELDEIKSLVSFSGDYKADTLINECLCGNILQYKKILSELYTNAVNQVFLLRILSNKIQRLLKIKESGDTSNNIDILINSSKPVIFWKERPLVKKQLLIWSLKDLKKILNQINNTELLCKKHPQIANTIFFNFFSKICKKASNFSL
tara:strand:- start:1624 stop:2646 length:1023 start_codon:yes stop_codon:yes gene_type:complete